MFDSRVTPIFHRNCVRVIFKDGVLSAFEHHCAECYNLQFTGFMLIPIGANLLRITTKHYPMLKKFVNWDFGRVS
jgi:hypothetical protein